MGTTLASATPAAAPLDNSLSIWGSPALGEIDPVQSTSFQLQGIESIDAEGDISNIIIEQFLGEGTQIIGIQWENVELRTIGNSFLNEAAIGFNGEVTARVGTADNFSGIGFYDSDGMIDLIGPGLDYILGEDGMLSIEFFETQDDSPDSADAFYAAGNLTVFYIPIPAPGSMVLLSLAGLVASRRHRD